MDKMWNVTADQYRALDVTGRYGRVNISRTQPIITVSNARAIGETIGDKRSA